MPNITPWDESAEYAEAQVAADQISKRITTVQADSQRIIPKLSTFKRATLEKLIKETKASYDAAVKRTKEFSGKSPDQIYIKTLELQMRTESAAIMKEAQAKVAALLADSKKNLAAATVFRTKQGPQAMAFQLGNAYLTYMKALQKELMAAAKEKTPSPNRTV